MKSYESVKLQAPILEPITLEEAKAQLRLTSAQTYDDVYISSLISVARDRAENYTNRYFSTQKVRIITSELPENDYIYLPHKQNFSVDRVSYIDENNQEIVINQQDIAFNQDLNSIFSLNWPSYYKKIIIDVTTMSPVEMRAAKQAMLMMITDMYELRTESIVGTSAAENPAVTAMLYPYRTGLGI